MEKILVKDNVIPLTLDECRVNIGKKTHKTTLRPFKSGRQTNTIKDVMMHPKLNIPCYTFNEDESYVEARRCVINN